jgi:PAS domain-containing protein
MKTKNNLKINLRRELQAANGTLDSLRVLYIQENHELKRLEFLLEAREKELNCYKRISEITCCSALSVPEALQKIVSILPEALQFPALTSVSISFDSRIYRSDNFEHTNWSMSKDLVFFGKITGNIEVSYLKNMLDSQLNPFLREEEEMLFSIADRISNFIEKRLTALSYQESDLKYRQMEDSIRDVFFEIDNSGEISYISPAVQKLLGYSQNELIGKSFLQIVGKIAE